MGMTLDVISIQEVAKTASLRLDPHHYLLRFGIDAIVSGVKDAVPMTPPTIRAVSNGENLPEEAYDVGGDGSNEYLYVSVGALSQFALRIDRCVPLKPPDEHAYSQDVAALACKPSEILLTRSGTPGIAWPCVLFEESTKLLPSGFVIRLDLVDSGIDPIYAAAILNHPVWRVWSASLAGGKRQRNLSQENLAELPIPRVPAETQTSVGAAYVEALRDIGDVLAEAAQLREHCDAVLSEHLSEAIVSLTLDEFRVDDVAVSNCAETDNLRLDARYHRGDVRKSLVTLERLACAPLGSLLTEPPIKRGQPTILAVDDAGIAERVVATVSLQDGLVAWDLTKPTDANEIAKSATKTLRVGDVLIAMDGEGSIGKAAAFHGDVSAVTDSHVALLRTEDEALADALSCFINSSLGQAQVAVATTGATGQTQLSGDDVAAFLIPTGLVAKANDVAKAYRAILTNYEALTRRVRRRLCEAASEVNAAIIAHATLSDPAREALSQLSTADDMLEVLGRLTPEMF
jgi:hypothetical protein